LIPILSTWANKNKRIKPESIHKLIDRFSTVSCEEGVDRTKYHRALAALIKASKTPNSNLTNRIAPKLLSVVKDEINGLSERLTAVTTLRSMIPLYTADVAPYILNLPILALL
jgi:hypothetical protein